jgi:hypothetical protein
MKSYGTDRVFVFSCLLFIFLCQISLPFYFKIAIFIGCLLPVYYYYYNQRRASAKHINEVKWKSGMVVMTMLNYIDLKDIWSSCRLTGLHYLHTLVVTSDPNGKLYGVELNFGRGRLEVKEGKVLDMDKESVVYGYSYPMEHYIDHAKEHTKDYLFRVYEPPEHQAPIPYSEELMNTIRTQDGFMDCVGFAGRYLLRSGAISDGYQLHHPVLKYTPITVHNLITEKGWTNQMYFLE